MKARELRIVASLFLASCSTLSERQATAAQSALTLHNVSEAVRILDEMEPGEREQSASALLRKAIATEQPDAALEFLERCGKGPFGALQPAVVHGYSELCKRLLEKGADAHAGSGRFRPRHAPAPNRDGHFSFDVDEEVDVPLILAIRNGHTDLVKLFLNAGCNPNAIVIKKDLEMLHVILNMMRYSVSVNRTIRINVGFMPQWAFEDMAVKPEKDDWVLIDGEHILTTLRPNQCEWTTALHLATEQGHTHIVNALLDQGASIDVANSSGETPFDVAVRSGHEELAGRFSFN